MQDSGSVDMVDDGGSGLQVQCDPGCDPFFDLEEPCDILVGEEEHGIDSR